MQHASHNNSAVSIPPAAFDLQSFTIWLISRHAPLILPPSPPPWQPQTPTGPPPTGTDPAILTMIFYLVQNLHITTDLCLVLLKYLAFAS